MSAELGRILSLIVTTTSEPRSNVVEGAHCAEAFSFLNCLLSLQHIDIAIVATLFVINSYRSCRYSFIWNDG